MSPLDECPHMLAYCPHHKVECKDHESRNCLHIKNTKARALTPVALQNMRAGPLDTSLDHTDYDLDQINRFLSDLVERGN